MSHDSSPRVLALVLAGGQGGRLAPLTEKRAKPAVPFLGTYRLIDFALSNCAHSGLTDVWVVEQYHPFELNKHLANGRPWDLDRLRGGLRVLPPYQTREGEPDGGFAEGNADALWRNRAFIADFNPDLLLVLSADHVYQMDFRRLIAFHLEQGNPALTLAATPLPQGETATRFGNVQFDPSGLVTDFAYKPDTPTSDWVTTEVFLYNAPRLLQTLEQLAAQTPTDGSGLKDFGHELLPHLVKQNEVRAFKHEAYWRDVGTLTAYFDAHQQFLSRTPPLVLDAPDWPTLTFTTPRLPARVIEGATVSGSLLSPGCLVSGVVRDSVLGPGCVVEHGATVENAVLLGNVFVATGAVVRHALVDENAKLAPGQTVIGSDAPAIYPSHSE